jgi:hypothetical protein
MNSPACAAGTTRAESGIYSNEVRDTRTDIIVVKSFKGGTLAEGLYKDIKDRVNTLGGQFVANCYIAFKANGRWRLARCGSRARRSARGWSFARRTAARSTRKAVDITGFTEGKKGRIVFRVPTFDD